MKWALYSESSVFNIPQLDYEKRYKRAIAIITAVGGGNRLNNNSLVLIQINDTR